MASFRDENVGRFNISMNDALAVGGIQGIGNFNGDLDKALKFEGARRNQMSKGNSVEVLHGDKSLAVKIADFVNSANVGMIQSGGRALPGETAREH
ncbi:MAG: hypothetical protein WA639_22140 [Candidatus Acidiferrum sp.]